MCRADKFLWSVRLFKTRNEAAEACRGGRVRINDTEAKASREVKKGDIIDLRKSNVNYRYKIIDIIDKRQPAKLVPDYLLDLTPQEELDKLNTPKESFFLYRERGMGRPTKKDRREMDDLFKNF